MKSFKLKQYNAFAVHFYFTKHFGATVQHKAKRHTKTAKPNVEWGK